MIGGQRAAVVTALYHYQGNLQFPRFVEEVFLVAGKEGFVLHFECFQPEAGAFATPLNGFYSSFVPRPSPEEDKPQQSNESKLPGVDNIPF